MPNCKVCGSHAETLGSLRAHYKAAGHPMKYSRKPRPASPVPQAPSDLGVMQKCVDVFEGAALDDDGLRRAVNYLWDRYMPAEEAAPDDEPEAVAS